ncbi:PorT family protein [candidate division WOR-3 bacterium]|nr:PorT family protein [candidate division WOR-3 bacterium]
MKGILAVMFLLLSCGLVFGQGVSIGANLGGSYNMWNYDVEGWDTYSGIGFGGGLVFNVDFMPMLGVELGVLYSMYNYSTTVEIGGINIDQSISMNNLVIPMLLKYKMQMPAVSPYFVLGPSIIRNLSGTIETSNGTSISTDIPDELLETDFCIQVGAGADISMTPVMGISPYARFQYNLTADDPDSENNSESMSDILFGVNLMYKIK